MKKILLVCFILTLTSLLFAEESEEIELPEVTTVISGESVKAGLDSLPDFYDVLEEPVGSGDVVPVLPDVEITDNDGGKTSVAETAEKSIYAEGQLGGGYPSLFKGDFSVYRNDVLNPFTLNFHHNSQAGFAGTPLTDGYNTRDTLMSVERTLTYKKFSVDFGGLYENEGNGFQNKVENISDVNNDLVRGHGKLSFSLPHNFSLGFGADADFYHRYDNITSSETFECPGWIKDAKTYDISPMIFANWNGKGFDITLDGMYWFGGIEPASDKMSLRGDFGLDLSWTKDRVKLYGNVDVAYGTTIDETAVVPFDVGVETSFPVYFSNRQFALTVEGGLDSYRNSSFDLEKKYRFTCFDQMPSESSLWFGKLDISLPIKTSFTCDLGVDYRTTAFDNGIYVPLYNTDSYFGLYGFEYRNASLLTTDFNFTYHYKFLSVKAGWHSNWMDVSVLEASQLLTVDVSLQGDASNWGVNLGCKLGFGNDTQMPVINLDSFFRVTPAVRLVLACEDIIKLCTGQGRPYAGQYVAEGGSVLLLVKFFF